METLLFITLHSSETGRPINIRIDCIGSIIDTLDKDGKDYDFWVSDFPHRAYIIVCHTGDKGFSVTETREEILDLVSRVAKI